jgi:hypothetical protein
MNLLISEVIYWNPVRYVFKLFRIVARSSTLRVSPSSTEAISHPQPLGDGAGHSGLCSGLPMQRDETVKTIREVVREGDEFSLMPERLRRL